jgi:hypothetical protein
MLLPDSTTHTVKGLARRGDTATTISVMRAFAQIGWAGPIAEVIGIYSSNVEVNGARVRGFLASLVPGILANNYYNLGGREFYEDWIEFTLRHRPNWADAIKDAADQADPRALEASVTALGEAVVDWVRQGRPT